MRPVWRLERTGLVICALAVVTLMVAAGQADAEMRRALVVGVNDYRNPMENLKGSVNDAKAMESILKVRFGFHDVVLLRDPEATRSRILDELRTLMFVRSKPGDVAVFYFSGHGSQIRNAASSEGDRMDETIVPYPVPRREDIRDKELGAILETAARNGVRITVILDSCHSGSMGRGIGTYRHPKFLTPDTHSSIRDPSHPDAAAAGALIVSAAQTHQIADETQDDDGTFGGVFTLALLRVMREAPVDENAAEVFFRAHAVMRHDDRSQEPAVDAGIERLRAPLFGPGLHTAGGKFAIASLGTDGADVVLEGGTAVGLALGSVLVRRAADGPPLTIELATVDLVRSRARVRSGSIATVHAGQLFDVTKWAVSLGAALRVHVPQQLPLAEVLAAASRLERLRTSKSVAIVDDPAKLSPTHVLVLEAGRWSLRGPDGRELSVGASPDARVVENALRGKGGVVGWPAPCDTRPCLYIRLPPPAQIVARLGVGKSPEDAIRDVAEADAQYVLAGRMHDGRLEYAWILAAAPASPRGAAGPGSAMPSRSRWIDASMTGPGGTVGALEDALLRIARVHDWLQMPSPADTGRFPYRLVLEKTGDSGVIGAEEVRAGSALTVGEHYELYLRADPDRLKRPDRVARNVYVLSLDSAGAINVLFPRGQSIGPTEAWYPIVDRGAEWPALERVGTAGFTVACPAGRETFILLKSAQALPDLWDIEQDAVTRAPLFDSTTGLERLLLSVGKRGRPTGPDRLAASEPDWSVERLEIESREGASPCSPGK